MVQFHFETKFYLFSLLVRTLPFHGIGASSILARDVIYYKINLGMISIFYDLRTKFINKFLIDGKKYNSFYILNNIFYFLNLKNKNNFKIFLHFFLIIEPLFFVEKIVSFGRLTQSIIFLPKKKKIRAILNILNDAKTKTHINKVNIFSYFLSQEIYNSLFKTSFTYNLYKLQNENFLKLKNNSHYRWF